MELGLAVIFGLHSVCSICLTLLNKQLAVEIPFPLTIARGPWQNVDLDDFLLLVALGILFTIVCRGSPAGQTAEVLFQCLASIPFTLSLSYLWCLQNLPDAV